MSPDYGMMMIQGGESELREDDDPKESPDFVMLMTQENESGL